MRWYFTEPGAKHFAGYNRFASGNWASSREGWHGVGEVEHAARPWSNGQLPGPDYTGQHICGKAEHFATGASITEGGQLPVGGCCAPHEPIPCGHGWPRMKWDTLDPSPFDTTVATDNLGNAYRGKIISVDSREYTCLLTWNGPDIDDYMLTISCQGEVLAPRPRALGGSCSDPLFFAVPFFGPSDHFSWQTGGLPTVVSFLYP